VRVAGDLLRSLKRGTEPESSCSQEDCIWGEQLFLRLQNKGALGKGYWQDLHTTTPSGEKETLRHKTTWEEKAVGRENVANRGRGTRSTKGNSSNLRQRKKRGGKKGKKGGGTTGCVAPRADRKLWPIREERAHNREREIRGVSPRQVDLGKNNSIRLVGQGIEWGNKGKRSDQRSKWRTSRQVRNDEKSYTHG